MQGQRQSPELRWKIQKSRSSRNVTPRGGTAGLGRLGDQTPAQAQWQLVSRPCEKSESENKTCRRVLSSVGSRLNIGNDRLLGRVFCCEELSKLLFTHPRVVSRLERLHSFTSAHCHEADLRPGAEDRSAVCAHRSAQTMINYQHPR